jgi:hypothetical protein
MRRGLRWSGVLATFLAALALTVAVAEPASAGKAKGLEKNGSKAADGGRDEPPGLVGNVHAKAKGQAKKAQEAAAGPPQAGGKKPDHAPQGPVRSPKPGKTGSAGGSRSGNAGHAGSSSNDAHHHVIVCHRTGSGSNPYVVLNIPWTAWSEAHDPDSDHAHPPLDGRVDLLLKDPASRPGAKDGFTAADCKAADPVAHPSPPSPPPSTGGGALGEEAGSPGRGQLPFTGLPLLIALLAALGAAVGAAGVAGGAREKRKRLQWRPRKASHLAHVGYLAAQEALDGAPDDPGAR